MNGVDIKEMVGDVIERIEGKVGDETVTFFMESGAVFRMHYYRDCCASCYLEDTGGDLEDITGYPLLMAEEISNGADELPNYEDESFTWTFYKFATAKGYCTLRWYGSSNGYYSESVTFERVS
jgi:hypothetical protein